MKIRSNRRLTEKELIILQNLPDWGFKERVWKTSEIAELLGVIKPIALKLLKGLKEKNYVRKIVAGRGYKMVSDKESFEYAMINAVLQPHTISDP